MSGSPSVSPSVRTNVDELISITNNLAKVVMEVCEQIRNLKEERSTAVGDVRNAYDLVISNKVWTLQTLIGAYWRNTLNLDLDKSEELIPTSTTHIETSLTGC